MMMQDGGWTQEWMEEEKASNLHTGPWKEYKRSDNIHGRIIGLEEDMLVARFARQLQGVEPFDITEEDV